MRRITLLLLLMMPVATRSQNLVPNPSFEDTLSHTNCITGIEIANKWFNPNAATPDLYSYKPSCGNSSLNNPSGYQLPRTGLCYAGIYGYVSPSRDYIGIMLDSNLSAGCTYYIDFYYSRANKFGLACDKLGVALTDDTTGFTAITTALPLIPAIKSTPGTLLTDSMIWQSINGYYAANGTERFLIIGNFYDDINTYWDTLDWNAPALNGAYYYIDDVRILPCGVTSIQTINNFDITILYQTNTKEVRITGDFKSSYIEVLQTDLLGRELLRQRLRCSNKNELKIEVNNSHSGISLLTIKSNNLLITKKIIQ